MKVRSIEKCLKSGLKLVTSTYYWQIKCFILWFACLEEAHKSKPDSHKKIKPKAIKLIEMKSSLRFGSGFAITFF